jgi:hypothetical protein
MDLLRSICSLFGSGCSGGKPRVDNERPVAADLGQEEAEREKTGKEQMSHMDDSAGGRTTRRKPKQNR